VPLTLADCRDEDVSCWGAGILRSPHHSAKHFKGYSGVAAVHWVQREACTAGRARPYRWLAFSWGRSLCLRYAIAVKANWPLETSLLSLNLLSLRQ